MLSKRFQKLLDAQIAREDAARLAIANERIEQFKREWKRIGRGKLEIYFGMGTMGAKRDGEWYDNYTHPGWAKPLRQLDEDLEEITDGYRMACPGDFVAEGK